MRDGRHGGQWRGERSGAGLLGDLGLRRLRGSLCERRGRHPPPAWRQPVATHLCAGRPDLRASAEERGWTIDYALPSSPPPGVQEPQHVGVEFTERMSGFFSPNEKEDFQRGYREGEADQTTF